MTVAGGHGCVDGSNGGRRAVLDVGPFQGHVQGFVFGDLDPAAAVVDVGGGTGQNAAVASGVNHQNHLGRQCVAQVVTSSDVLHNDDAVGGTDGGVDVGHRGDPASGGTVAAGDVDLHQVGVNAIGHEVNGVGGQGAGQSQDFFSAKVCHEYSFESQLKKTLMR